MLHYHLSIKISEVTTKSQFLRLLSLIRLEGITQTLEAGLFAPQIMVLLLLSSACLKYDNNFRFIVRPYRDGGSRPDRMSLFLRTPQKTATSGLVRGVSHSQNKGHAAYFLQCSKKQ